MQKRKITLDKRQKEAAEICHEVALSIKEFTFIKKFKNVFLESNNSLGIYMHGGVGRGKTLLMHQFYDALNVRKEFVHFQKFMQDLHIKLHHNEIEDLAADIASRVRVLCLDEFEIKDITDAMMIMRLFRDLAKRGVFIFLTTNIEPDNLYLDGLQRESFLPFIAMVKRDFRVMQLDAEKDYRYDALASIRERILYPLNSKTKARINKIKSDLCDPQELSKASIKVFARETIFQKAHQNILFTDFEELFERNLSYADYVEICKHFEIIVLESVRVILEGETDIITRFINFIDNVYFYRKLLFIELETNPEQIYTKGKKSAEFMRAISRLNEMNSDNYLNAKENISNDRSK